MQRYSRILVTGATGFVGRHLLPRLKAQFPETQLIAAVKAEERGLPQISSADVVLAFDLMQPERFAQLLDASRPDALVHLAAQSSVGASLSDAGTTWASNLMGTVALGEAVLGQARSCRFIMASSAEVYGLSFRAPEPLDEGAPLAPANPYAASKAATDLAVGEMALRGLVATRLRLFNHTGAGQSDRFVLAAFARQIARMEAGLQGRVMHVGNLDLWRDFLDVRDVCDAYAAVLASEAVPGAIYNVCSGTPRRLRDVLDDMISQSSVVPSIEVDSLRVRPTDLERVAGNAGRAHRELGWSTTISWPETLDALLDDWRGRELDPCGVE